jgi:MYXO-CTERM domain-containing protein
MTTSSIPQRTSRTGPSSSFEATPTGAAGGGATLSRPHRIAENKGMLGLRGAVMLAVLTLSARVNANDERDAGAHSCVGRWVGAAKNSNSSEAWSIEMVIAAPGDRCGTIEYGSLKCGGQLETCVDKGGGRMLIRERYTHDVGQCAPAANLDITCEGDTMRWRWYGGWEEVHTRLTRVPVPATPRPTETPGVGATPSVTVTPPPPAPPAREPERSSCACQAAAPGDRTALPWVGVLAAVLVRRKRFVSALRR